MESILLVERLKQAIEQDFKEIREELDKTKQEKKELADKNDNLRDFNKELKEDNLNLTKTLKEVKEKYDHLQGKLKRKQDEIKKKEKWWDRYRYTAETMIKKLRTQGTFSPDVLHEVSRDLVDIMEEASSKESGSSQEMEVKNSSKLTTSKEGKKKVRYTEVSPENIHSKSNPSGRIQSSDKMLCVKEFKELPENMPASNSAPTVQPRIMNSKTGNRMKTEKIYKEKEKDNVTSTSKKIKQNKDDDRNNINSKYTNTDTAKKGHETDFNSYLTDETCDNSIGYPSLTSTPMFGSSNKIPTLSVVALHDLSIIPKDLKNDPSKADVMECPVTDSADTGSMSPLTPGVPGIFENLLSRKTSLDPEHNSTTKNSKELENIASSGKKEQVDTRQRKYLNKNMRVVISGSSKLGQNEQDNGTSPSILRNLNLGDKMNDDDTIDYPVVTEENPGSPSILAVDIKPVGEQENLGVMLEEGHGNLKRKMSLNGNKRKRSRNEEKEMKNPLDDKEGREIPPDKKPYRNTTIQDHFKIPAKPILSTKLKKQTNTAPGSPECCSIVLLSDEEDDNKMESSSVDMFAYDGKSLSKDLSNEDKVVIDVIQNEDYGTSDKITSSSKSKDPDVNKETESENILLDEEFPGFRKPDELNYKNIQVVRKKDERTKLNGFSCRDCEQYYGEMTESERKKKLKHCSRHRAKYPPPPSTPPGFWNLSFPETEEYIKQGMMVTGDQIPPQKLRRPRKRRLLRTVHKKS